MSMPTLRLLLVGAACQLWSGTAPAAEVIQISQDNWEQIVPAGKEADWIYGDYVLHNKRIVAVVAQPVTGRNANMTVRDVSGALIDLTLRDNPSDQLSCFYPGGALSPLRQATHRLDGDMAVLTCSSGEAAADAPHTVVEYRLGENDPFVTVTSTFTNSHAEPIEFELQDAVRADRDFRHGVDSSLNMYWCHDLWWGQAYGVVATDHKIKPIADSFDRGRPIFAYEGPRGSTIRFEAGSSYKLKRLVFPGRHTVDVRAVARQVRGEQLESVKLQVVDAKGPVDAAEVTILRGEDAYGNGLTSSSGVFVSSIPSTDYRVKVAALGRGSKTVPLRLSPPEAQKIELPEPGYVVAEITNRNGQPIPAKVQFQGKDVEDPFFGPDTKDFGVMNLRYTADGRFNTAIAPGTYDVIVSRGNEYDAVFRTITVRRGEVTTLAAKLSRSVDTEGWISSDFHSHSSPSGDNTSNQLGRVLNLLAEHVEFAPCTEHNRISSYVPHLRSLDAEGLMATCSGMELTGQPLPINHQNAFPLVHHPHTQDGGGPQTDENPIVQIERLAMWDDGSAKLVQENHPNLPQIWMDRDLDGRRDGGFAAMFGYMDVVEVHPPADIFASPGAKTGQYNNAIHPWLQMLNSGYRIPGVVNTDAHYNFHGSGWLRNYIRSSTDDPAQIQVMEMVHESEQGHLVMTNGPFLEFSASTSDAKAIPGDDLSARGGTAQLDIRVQCPNWFDVNRVQVFFNGRPVEEFNFTRRQQPKKFGSGVVKFEETIPIKLTEDTHIIVATIGEGLQLGPVMGPLHGQDAPVAVTNPIFVDVDGSGFSPNRDRLDIPLPAESP